MFKPSQSLEDRGAMKLKLRDDEILLFVVVTLLSATRGSLLTRSLADIVKKDDFVLNSEYLITLLVVVPKWVWTLQDLASYNSWTTNLIGLMFFTFRPSYTDWQKMYETLAEMVVPRSSKWVMSMCQGHNVTSIFRHYMNTWLIN